jgi:hypothetical protein
MRNCGRVAADLGEHEAALERGHRRDGKPLGLRVGPQSAVLPHRAQALGQVALPFVEGVREFAAGDLVALGQLRY